MFSCGGNLYNAFVQTKVKLYVYYAFPLAVFLVYYLLTTGPAAGFLAYHIPDCQQRRTSVGLILACVSFILIVALHTFGALEV